MGLNSVRTFTIRECFVQEFYPPASLEQLKIVNSWIDINRVLRFPLPRLKHLHLERLPYHDLNNFKEQNTVCIFEKMNMHNMTKLETLDMKFISLSIQKGKRVTCNPAIFWEFISQLKGLSKLSCSQCDGLRVHESRLDLPHLRVFSFDAFGVFQNQETLWTETEILQMCRILPLGFKGDCLLPFPCLANKIQVIGNTTCGGVCKVSDTLPQKWLLGIKEVSNA